MCDERNPTKNLKLPRKHGEKKEVFQTDASKKLNAAHEGAEENCLIVIPLVKSPLARLVARLTAM